jgi:8-oxo-dGTP pyrophosphatase MutT (NUDIX family)
MLSEPVSALLTTSHRIPSLVLAFRRSRALAAPGIVESPGGGAETTESLADEEQRRNRRSWRSPRAGGVVVEIARNTAPAGAHELMNGGT